jgi:hypothetical protein
MDFSNILKRLFQLQYYGEETHETEDLGYGNSEA